MACLDDAGWRELPDGSLMSADRIVFRRTPQRVTRRLGHELVDAGSPVVTDVWPDGLTIAEGLAARRRWADVLPRLASGRPIRDGNLVWVGHVWESDNGLTLLRFDGDGCA